MYKYLFFGFLIGVLFTYFLIEIKRKCLIFTDAKEERKRIIETLLRGVGRWSVASLGDESPLIRLLHANYAAGYLWSLLDISSSEEIEEISGVPYIQIRSEVTKAQDEANRNVISACPQFAPPPSVLTKISGEGI